MADEIAEQGPLAHLRVLDLTVARAGPTAVRLLADWGANVIRIEPPAADKLGSVTGVRRGPDEQNLHRNKRSLILNLKSKQGHALLLDMVRASDVLVENFRVAVKQRLEIDYESLARVNPRLIYASISGFGQTGPLAERPGVDQIVQGMSGLMSVTGDQQSGPMRAGVAISDTAAGMFLGQGILLALLDRERTGEGQWVHTSLLEAMLNKLDFQGARYTMMGEVAQPQGNQHPTQVPMGTFPAADGSVNLAASSSRMWQRFCTAMQAPELLDDERFANAQARQQNRDALQRLIGQLTRRHRVVELVTRLNEAGVPCGPVNDIAQAFDSPQVRHLRMAQGFAHPELGELQLLRSPINLSRCTPHAGRAAPDPGADTDELLAEFGVTASKAMQLRSVGAIQ